MKLEKWEAILNNGSVKSFATFSFTPELKKIPTKRGEILDETFCSGILFFAPYFSNKITGGNISIYACVPDYHFVLKNLLTDTVYQLQQAYPKEHFEIFIDSSPLKEVELAVKSGLGVLGKNGMLIHPTYGSYGFLGAIITTLQLPFKEYPRKWCLDCGKCIAACPGNAIERDGHICEERCLSSITQKKGKLNPEEQTLVKKGGLVWGCDICQQVCPMNKGAQETYLKEFQRDIVKTVTEETLVGRGHRKRAFGFRGKQVLLRNSKLLKEKEKGA